MEDTLHFNTKPGDVFVEAHLSADKETLYFTREVIRDDGGVVYFLKTTLDEEERKRIGMVKETYVDALLDDKLLDRDYYPPSRKNDGEGQLKDPYAYTTSDEDDRIGKAAAASVRSLAKETRFDSKVTTIQTHQTQQSQIEDLTQDDDEYIPSPPPSHPQRKRKQLSSSYGTRRSVAKRHGD